MLFVDPLDHLLFVDHVDPLLFVEYLDHLLFVDHLDNLPFKPPSVQSKIKLRVRRNQHYINN